MSKNNRRCPEGASLFDLVVSGTRDCGLRFSHPAGRGHTLWRVAAARFAVSGGRSKTALFPVLASE